MKTAEDWAAWVMNLLVQNPHCVQAPDLAAFLREGAAKHAAIHEDYARQQRVLAKERDRIAALERDRGELLAALEALLDEEHLCDADWSRARALLAKHKEHQS